MKAAIVWGVIGLIFLVGLIVLLPELKIFQMFFGAIGMDFGSAGSAEAIQDIVKIQLQYLSIIVIVLCLTVGIGIILFLSLSQTGDLDPGRKLEFA